MRKLGLQLFTVRESLKNDVAETLKQVAKAGYAGIELFGPYGNLILSNHRDLLADLNLTVLGGHVGLANLIDDDSLTQTVSTYAQLGATHLALAALPIDQRTGLEHYRNASQICNHAGKVARAHGITFSYHNHDFEFNSVEDGRTGYDVLLGETDPALVKFELDIFWVEKAGRNVPHMIQELGSRLSILHLKDMTRDENRTFEIVGEGVLDFDVILPAAEAAGADWYVVEQDRCPQGELESMRKSYQNIKLRGWS
ncbi:MAG: sugar phosphate isomerase/epimerase [Anaerolineae bacterium]|nr:sugar phosphate isomerase/epimerase [Anaerolineae bacterium]